MQASDKIQLDAIDKDFQEAPEYFSTLPWVVRVMGRGAVANQISSNVPSTSGAVGIGHDSPSREQQQQQRLALRRTFSRASGDSTASGKLGPETARPHLNRDVPVDNAVPGRQPLRLRKAERLRQQRQERRAKRKAAIEEASKTAESSPPQAPEVAPEVPSNDENTPKGSVLPTTSTSIAPSSGMKPFSNRLTFDELQLKRINEGRAILMEQQDVATNAATLIVENCGIELAAGLETFALTMDQLMLVRNHLRAMRATVTHARLATKSDRNLLQLYYDRTELQMTNRIMLDLASLREESIALPAAIDDGDYENAARLLNDMKAKLKVHQNLESSIPALASLRDNMSSWHDILVGCLSRTVVDAVYVGLVSPVTRNSRGDATVMYDDVGDSSGGEAKYANGNNSGHRLHHESHHWTTQNGQISGISANSELSLCADLARFVHIASTIGPDSVAELCSQLSASTELHLCSIMDRICASIAVASEGMDHTDDNDTSYDDWNSSQKVDLPQFSLATVRAAKAMTLAGALVLTRHYVVMSAVVEAYSVFGSEAFASKQNACVAQDNGRLLAQTRSGWQPPPSKIVSILEAALGRQPGDLTLCDVADIFHFVSEVFSESTQNAEDKSFEGPQGGYNLLHSVWVPLQRVIKSILSKHTKTSKGSKQRESAAGSTSKSSATAAATTAAHKQSSRRSSRIGFPFRSSRGLGIKSADESDRSQSPVTDGTSDGNQCRFQFQFQNDEAWLSSLWEEQQQPHHNTDKMNVPVSSSSSSSSDPNNLSTTKDFLWMAHITGPSMLAMVDLGPALCEFAIRARKWVHAHDLDNTSDKNRSSAENVESLLERFISKEHELAFEMLREDIIKTDVSTLYVRGDAMMPVPMSTLRHDLIPFNTTDGIRMEHVGCIAQGAIDTWHYFVRLLGRLTCAPSTCCDVKVNFAENSASREKMFRTLCREVLHNYARHLREMMSDVVLNPGGGEEDMSVAWSRHRNMHTQLPQGARTRDVLGKILKNHAPELNQRVWCHTTPAKGDEEYLADICLGEVLAKATEVTNSMPAFYLEVSALEADIMELSSNEPMPPEGFRLLSVTGGLDILALITTTAQWLHNMAINIDLSAMAHDTSFSRENSDNSNSERHRGSGPKTHLSNTYDDAMSSALQTIGELADSALHCLRTEVRLNCYAQIHLMRGRRYSWNHASHMQREARESPVPEAFVVSLAQYLCSVEEEVMPSLSKSSLDFVVYGLPQLLTQLILEGIRHVRRNQVCLLGMKQIVCNCRTLSNVWACCRGTDDLCAEQTQEDANCFKVAERAIELCTLPPMWCRELLEYCTESGFEELLLRQANGAPLMGSSIPIEISPEDIAAFRLLHSRGIFDIMATVNRNGQLWQGK